ncbi:MAG: hypothetical protein WCJ64_02475 [Rhodospirillaceae bacterium]
MTYEVALLALREIARVGPSDEPADIEFDSLEEAERHGIDVGLFQAADIARRALEELSVPPLYSDTPVNPGELSGADIQHLVHLNRGLRELEGRLHTAAVALARELGARKLDPGDWLDDFEIGLSIELYPPVGDPTWDGDDDNAVGRITRLVTRTRPDPPFGFGSALDHTEPGREIEGIRQCWALHQALDHIGLTPGDLARIGLCWGDLAVTLQTSVAVPDFTLGSEKEP